MIFSNKISKVVSGTTPTLYATNNKQMSLFVFNNAIIKAEIELGSVLRCFKTSETYPYKFATILDSGFLCLCLNDTFYLKKVSE